MKKEDEYFELYKIGFCFEIDRSSILIRIFNQSNSTFINNLFTYSIDARIRTSFNAFCFSFSPRVPILTYLDKYRLRKILRKMKTSFKLQISEVNQSKDQKMKTQNGQYLKLTH